MSWLALALIGVVSVSVGNLFQRLAMKEEGSDPIISVIVFQLLLGSFAITFALIKGFHLPPREILFPAALLSSVLYGFGGIFFFKAIKVIEASEVALLSTFGAVVSIITAYLFLGERLTSYQLLGVMFIIISIIVVKFERQSLKFSRGSLLTLVGTSMFGLAVVNDTNVIHSYDAASYLVVTSFMPAAILSLAFPQKVAVLVRQIRRRVSAKLITFSFLYSIQAITFYLALELGALASQMNTIAKTQTVLTVVLAAIFLREVSHFGRKALSALLVTIGILLIR